jgi:O-acetyl-ADP-ribose deacetylase (regulator of RNase III)
MIKTAYGDLLQADADALVNTVNTVGVMGKGLALQFKHRYPTMFEAYRAACIAGEVRIGRMHVWETGLAPNARPRLIVNFPTKNHWRDPSKLAYIEAGLVDLVKVIQERQITSIAVPPLGAGLGRLPWREVLAAIYAALDDVDTRVLLYEPSLAARR